MFLVKIWEFLEAIVLIPNEIKADLDTWFDKRIKELGQLKNLHYALLGLKKDEYKEKHQNVVDNMIFAYSEIGGTLIEGEGVIRSLPKEFKSDIVSHLRSKAKLYTDETAKEAEELADIIQNRVPLSTKAGRVSRQWLKRKGYTKEDLIIKDNIQQVGRKIYKGLELE